MADILKHFFYTLIYEPILAVIDKELGPQFKPNVKLNAADFKLLVKIQKGEIVYDGAYFIGRFDAQSSREIRKLGGEWDPKKKGFKFRPGLLTPDLKVSISASKERQEKVNKGLMTVLGDLEDRTGEAVENLDLSLGLDNVVKGLQSQTKRVMDALGVQYKLTPDQADVIRREYTDNMELYIKTFTDEHIVNLRKDVQANAVKGFRFSELRDMIEHDYGVTKSKAEFLAQQETSLFMAKFRQQRFLDAGVNFYVWQTVGDRKVRDDHKRLNGKIFQFGDPPIVDTSAGRRGEPGEDYRCRCIARPVVQKVHKVGSEWRIVD